MSAWVVPSGEGAQKAAYFVHFSQLHAKELNDFERVVTTRNENRSKVRIGICRCTTVGLVFHGAENVPHCWINRQSIKRERHAAKRRCVRKGWVAR